MPLAKSPPKSFYTGDLRGVSSVSLSGRHRWQAVAKSALSGGPRRGLPAYSDCFLGGQIRAGRPGSAAGHPARPAPHSGSLALVFLE